MESLDTFIEIVPLVIIGGALVFIIYAWAKGWFKGARRGAFTSQVVMHDWLNKNKREAIEYIIDEEEDKEKKDAPSGEDKKSGTGNGEGGLN